MAAPTESTKPTEAISGTIKDRKTNTIMISDRPTTTPKYNGRKSARESEISSIEIVCQASARLVTSPTGLRYSKSCTSIAIDYDVSLHEWCTWNMNFSSVT